MTATGLLNWKKTPHYFFYRLVDKADELKPGSSVLNKEQNFPELISKSNISN